MSTQRHLKWLNQNILTVLTGFLLVFLPLLPKLPLIEVLPGYIVRVRIDDIVIALVVLVFLVKLIQKKVSFATPLSKWMAAYIAIGLLSVISGVLVTKTIPMEGLHIAKAMFHWLRNIEYLALFFVGYWGTRNRDTAKKLVVIFPLVMGLVAIYGFGQRYLYWPVYSTMNREFASGIRLYLTENARVPSTFGGHYDLASFTLVAMCVILGILLLTKKLKSRVGLFLIFLSSLWILILTASRSSFIGYLAGVTILMGLLIRVKGLRWAAVRWIGLMAISLFVMLSFGDLSSRYADLLGLTGMSEKYSFLFKSAVNEPEEGMSLTEIQQVTTSTDTPPSRVRPGGELPPDVFEDVPLTVETASGSTTQVSRTYSENAYRYGLSVAIRLDALWPRAIEGLKKNPLLGSGYSTLTKSRVDEFTEAESTDNNFLRTLGETGILGFVAFYGMLVVMIKSVLVGMKELEKEPLLLGFCLGMVGGVVGLLVNALYIDVFVASKIAEPFWLLSGMLMAILIKFGKKQATK